MPGVFFSRGIPRDPQPNERPPAFSRAASSDIRAGPNERPLSSSVEWRRSGSDGRCAVGCASAWGCEQNGRFGLSNRSSRHSSAHPPAAPPFTRNVLSACVGAHLLRTPALRILIQPYCQYFVGSSLKTERVARKVYRTRDRARADVFDYIERFYNPKRRYSTLGYLSPMEFENQMRLA